MGRVVMKGGEAPPSGATVTILTGNRWIDAPETAERIGLPRGSEGDREWFQWDEIEERVRAIGGWTYAHRTESAADGAFSVAVPHDLPEFWFEVECDFAFFEGGEERFELDDPQVRDGVLLVLQPAGRVEGILIGPGRDPVGFGEVNLHRASSTHGFADFPLAAVADAEGRFVFRAALPGVYDAGAIGPGCARALRRGIEVRTGEVTSVDFVLPIESYVAGRVVDEEGRGIEGASVDANRGMSSTAIESFGRGGTAQADAEGRFRIGSLEPDAYQVSVRHWGMLSPEGQRVVLREGSGIENLRFVLARGRRLAGRVLDLEGNPIANASVSGFPDQSDARAQANSAGRWSTQSARTSEDGSFALTGLLDCRHELTAYANGFGRVEKVPAEPGQEIEIRLPRSASLAGTIRAEDTGEPILEFGVVVRDFRPSVLGFAGGSHPRRITSPDGSFRLDNLEPLPHQFLFRAEGFLPVTTERIELESGAERSGLEIRLPRGGTIRGRVIDSATRGPVAGAVVEEVEEANAFDPMSGPWDRGGARTEVDGSFERTGIAPGRTRLRARHAAFLEGTSEAVVVASGEVVEGVEIALSRGGAIEGRAVDASGVPFSGGRVEVFSPTTGRRFRTPERASEIDEEGFFRVEALSPGEWKVEARSAPGPRRAEEGETAERVLHASVAVENGKTSLVIWSRDLEGRCRVRGRVVVEGGEEVRARVSILPGGIAADAFFPPAAPEKWETLAARDGSYVLEGVPSGPAELVVAAGFGMTTNVYPVTIPPSEEFVLDVAVPEGRIAGRVVRASDGSPVEAFWVRAQPLDVGAGQRRSISEVSSFVGGDGRYALRHLAPGRYLVSVGPAPNPHGQNRAVVPLAIATGGPVTVSASGESVFDFRLLGTGSAEVAVVDPHGSPVPRAWVCVFQADPEAISDPLRFQKGGQAWTDGGGVADIRGLAPGTYVATVIRSDFAAPWSEPLEVTEGSRAEFRLQLREGARVKVHLLDAAGAHIASAHATFRDDAGRATFAHPREADGDGPGVRVAVLAPGSYLLEAFAAGFEPHAETVTIGEASSDLFVRLTRQK